MLYSAIGLAVIGVGAGLAFRWKVLLPVIVLLPLAAIIFSASRGFSYKNAAIVIIVAEGILQAGYFAGLLIRSIAIASLRPGGALNFFKARRRLRERANDRQTSPPARCWRSTVTIQWAVHAAAPQGNSNRRANSELDKPWGQGHLAGC